MKKLWLFIGILSLVACKEVKKESAAAEVAKPLVKLFAFDGGTVQANMLELFSEDDTYKGESKVFADAFYVIQHPKGNLIWDAGLPEMLVGMPEPFTDPSGAFTVSRKDSVQNQLGKIGLAIDDFDYIALSHTHFDHSGHANRFKDATWLVQEAEYNFITNDTIKVQQVDNYNAIKELTKVKTLAGDYDVFGDGTVVIMAMPGHTPGHQVLFLNLADSGAVLLTGDLYHFEENRKTQMAPIFNFDIPQTKASMKSFEALAKEKNARVIIQHSTKDFAAMPIAPAYLQ
jgi:glyoxylase-like metal-dependent hydrolase (beta-lactamase superfamily II)